MLTTNQKGAIAETALIHAAVRLGIEVYTPVVEGGRYDLILNVRERLWRVQCKWAVKRGEVLVVACYSSRRTREGVRRRRYTARDIDAFAAYSADLDRCYFLPFERFGSRTCIQLRLSPARNNQRLGIHRADDFEFAATLGGAGP